MLILQVHVILFLPEKRGLQPIGSLPSRGIAPSGFRPLRKIPHCCLPQESGPCLSSSVADRPLRPAIDRSLGEPLPHQQTNLTQASLIARGPKVPRFSPQSVCGISSSFPELSPTTRQIPTRSSPVRHFTRSRKSFLVRLACLRRAANVQSEP